MKSNLKIYKDKIIRMLDFIKVEYNDVISKYSEEGIIQKAIPLRVVKEVDKNKRKEINDLIYLIFSPSLKQMSKMIDAGIIEWAEIANKVELKEIIDNKELLIELFYESHEKLYIYKQIKYNLTFDFIMQMYLFFEKEIVFFVQNNFVSSKCNNIFSAIKIMEKNLNYNIDAETKKGIDLYRNIINVYKHGYGDSFISIMNSNPELLNYTDKDEDMFFVFKLDKINIEELYNHIIKLLEELYQIVS